ncbi:pyridoxal 4-dehydrogenase [Rhodococcus sp. ACS1]|uniref:aldo/keto reductase n=1 Tax=Rhodococcus sp. ACS1 TaxID=2028570 RepID=UPI000BB12B67|nr:aldo/keto reductase [Rhodococcus sp. ACS1]PBC36633.1 pyridoxal 4-dehydrogenase [Rhodococcus sp. ACS1]
MKITDTRQLDRSGLSLGVMSFDGAPIGNVLGRVTDDEAHELISSAWDLGARYFDSAPLYGNGLGEYRLGHGLRERDRDSYVLSTKVGRVISPSSLSSRRASCMDTAPLEPSFDYSYDGVMRSVEQSLHRMLTDRFDILFIHDCDRHTHGHDQPEIFRQALSSAYPALESLRSQGVVKALGFATNEVDVCHSALKNTDADCFLLSGRYTLLEQESLDDLLPACQEACIGLILGGVYNSGILATGPVKGATFNDAPVPPAVRKKTARIQKICSDHNVPLRAVALQFAIAHPAVASVCVRAGNQQEQQFDAELFEYDIPTELWADLRAAELIRADAPTPGDVPRTTGHAYSPT